jgi:hypothetical protein
MGEVKFYAFSAFLSSSEHQEQDSEAYDYRDAMIMPTTDGTKHRRTQAYAKPKKELHAQKRKTETTADGKFSTRNKANQQFKLHFSL